MYILNLVLLMSFIWSQSMAKPNTELSPESFSSASLTIAFDKTIKLNRKNNFRFPVMIDSHNKCTLYATQPMVIRVGTEWKSESKTEWNDWDLKNFSFKLTNRNKNVTLNCDLNLTGEILLFNSDTKHKALAECTKKGGRTHSSPKSALARQTYCVKRIPKLKYKQFRNAFAKSSISIQIDLSSENDEMPM